MAHTLEGVEAFRRARDHGEEGVEPGQPGGAGQLRYSTARQALEGDTNGDGVVDLQVTLANGYVPVGDEFIL